MKKILILFITITSASIYAQEKQNDATWEETVEFLRSNINKFDLTLSYRDIKTPTLSQISKKSFIINKKEIIVKIERKDTKQITMVSGSLKDLKSITYIDKLGGLLSLEFIKNSVNFSTETYSEKQNTISIGFCNKQVYDGSSLRCVETFWKKEDEFVKRILKAFKHLAYLANEKRKKSKF